MALAHTILAFLADRPYSGYDLAKEFNGSVGFFWMATHQQIYRELTKLKSQGWVRAETICQQGRPNKKLYFITETGRKQLAEWIAQPSEKATIREDLIVKTFAGDLVPHEIIVKELERRRQFHLEKMLFLREKEQRCFQNPQKLSLKTKFHYLTLSRGIRYHADWVAWCNEAIHLLS